MTRQAQQVPVGPGHDHSTHTSPGPRIGGVDLARGLALLGMVATHVYDTFDHGQPTAATVVAAGRSAATFATVAGVSIALMTGGARVVQGRARTAARAGLLARAAVIGLLGLLLGSLDVGVQVILVFYGVLFVLALPLLALRPRVLVLLTAVAVAVGPVLILAATRLHLPAADTDSPSLGTLLTDPLGTVDLVLLTGEYAVVVYLAYLCAGLAVGRLDLRSPRVAGALLAGGVALAVTARMVSSFLLDDLGGLHHLLGRGGIPADEASAATTLLWDPDRGTSWWYLALPSPHSHTPVDLAHTLGSALAVIGACLLLSRVAATRRLLAPVEAAGTMPLTLYCGHLLVLDTGLLEDEPTAQFLLVTATCLLFAVVWRRRHSRGPLEWLVAKASARARTAVLAGPSAATGRGTAGPG